MRTGGVRAFMFKDPLIDPFLVVFSLANEPPKLRDGLSAPRTRKLVQCDSTACMNRKSRPRRISHIRWVEIQSKGINWSGRRGTNEIHRTFVAKTTWLSGVGGAYSSAGIEKSLAGVELDPGSI